MVSSYRQHYYAAECNVLGDGLSNGALLVKCVVEMTQQWKGRGGI